MPPALRQRALSSIELSFDYAPRALRGNHPLSFFYFAIVTLYDNTHQVGCPTPTLYPIVKEKSMVSFSKKHFCRFAQNVNDTRRAVTRYGGVGCCRDPAYDTMIVP